MLIQQTWVETSKKKKKAKKWRKWEEWVTMQREWWWWWGHSSSAFSECSVWSLESQSSLHLTKRRGTIRVDLASGAERDDLTAPATAEGALSRGICATASEDGLTVTRRRLGLCRACMPPILHSSSSLVTTYSTGEAENHHALMGFSILAESCYEITVTNYSLNL